ncbi:hypothetical protein L1887_54885 [Cichorium endivia]|nr:hypothetical protein L1887_54885 [Cichorium endivia]
MLLSMSVHGIGVANAAGGITLIETGDSRHVTVHDTISMTVPHAVCGVRECRRPVLHYVEKGCRLEYNRGAVGRSIDLAEEMT